MRLNVVVYEYTMRLLSISETEVHLGIALGWASRQSCEWGREIVCTYLVLGCLEILMLFLRIVT